MKPSEKINIHRLISLFSGVLGVVMIAVIFLIVLNAVKGSMDIRSKAATNNRQIVKTWDFNGKSVEQWSKSEGKGTFGTENSSLAFYLYPQSIERVKNTEEIIMPSGLKYIHFSMAIEKTITPVSVETQKGMGKTSITGGGPCTTDASCPTGYGCASVQQSSIKRCIAVQPTASTSQTIPLTITALVSYADKTGVHWNSVTVPTTVVVDSLFHTYDLKLTDRLVRARVKDITFEFPTETSEIQKIPLKVMIKSITLQGVVSLVKTQE